MANVICQKLGKSDPNTLNVATAYIQQRYIEIYEKEIWLDSQFMMNFTMPITGTIILSPLVDRIMAVYDTASFSALPAIQLGTLFRAQPYLIGNNSPGNTLAYNELPPVACSQLPVPGFLTITSNSTNDNGIGFRISGDLNGAEFIETVTLGGTISVNTAFQYDTPYVNSKSLTTGIVTVKDSAGNVINTLMPYENERKYPRIQAVSFPTVATVFTVLFKRKVDPLVDPNDTPRLRNIDNALVAYGMADMYEYMRQNQKAQSKMQEAQALIEQAIDIEQNQQGSIMQITPVSTGEWNRNDWEGNYPLKQYF